MPWSEGLAWQPKRLNYSVLSSSVLSTAHPLFLLPPPPIPLSYGNADDLRDILHSLQRENDYYLLRHDFASYLEAQGRVDTAFQDRPRWLKMSILSTAGMGKFSTDRT